MPIVRSFSSLCSCTISLYNSTTTKYKLKKIIKKKCCILNWTLGVKYHGISQWFVTVSHFLNKLFLSLDGSLREDCKVLTQVIFPPWKTFAIILLPADRYFSYTNTNVSGERKHRGGLHVHVLKGIFICTHDFLNFACYLGYFWRFGRVPSR